MIFTNKEYSLLNKITADFSRRAKHATEYTFETFIKEWRDFVDQVESGYTMTIDDYTNDLSIRELIDELLQKISAPLKEKVVLLIEPLDEKLKQSTYELRNPLTKRENPPWYWYRMPKKLVGELKEDKESLKIN